VTACCTDMHCQNCPPTGPCRRNGASHCWRGLLRTDTDEVAEQLVRTGIPPSADLAPEHNELLWAAVQLRVSARRPSERLRHVQKSKAAAGLCATAATQV